MQEKEDEDVQDEDLQDVDVQDEDLQDVDVQDEDVQDEDVQDMDVQDEDVQDVDVPSCPACSLNTPMGSDGINFTGVTVLLNSDTEGTCVQARKDRSRYARRRKGMKHCEIQRLQKRRDDEEALKGIQAVYPQCAECLYHLKSQKLLMNHMCGGVFTPKDVLSNAMKHANELLSRMDFTVH